MLPYEESHSNRASDFCSFMCLFHSDPSFKRVSKIIVLYLPEKRLILLEQFSTYN